jgi:hypothetical protein
MNFTYCRNSTKTKATQGEFNALANPKSELELLKINLWGIG